MAQVITNLENTISWEICQVEGLNSTQWKLERMLQIRINLLQKKNSAKRFARAGPQFYTMEVGEDASDKDKCVAKEKFGEKICEGFNSTQWKLLQIRAKEKFGEKICEGLNSTQWKLERMLQIRINVWQ
ncbi:hypothetical protein QE152_g31115 [Popillia japonica]|uniref:Uncharacterized protein n=1 Tax=Popillia japonica TaxID=7064 RepID=A0AAW1JCT0_POPJA